MQFFIPGGEVRVEEDGLYWQISAVCHACGPQAPRLYCDGRCLGLFLPEGGVWRLARRVSRRSCPIGADSRFSLGAERCWRYDPGEPLPQMADFRRLTLEVRGGELWLRLCSDQPPANAGNA